MIDTGRPIKTVADEIGVGPQLLGKWVAVERAAMEDPSPALDADERAELERLRVEVKELRMDRAFPRKRRRVQEVHATFLDREWL